MSNLTGTWITAEQATNPSYWARHLRYTVRFAEGLQQLLKKPERILLEIGPGRTLSTLAKRHPDHSAEQVVLSSLRHPQQNQSDVAFLLKALGQFWLAGGQMKWSGFYTAERRHRLSLPTYPFERQRYWVEPPKPATEGEKLPHLWQSVVAAAHKQAQQGISALDNPTYRAKKASLERLCVAYMGKALKDLGAFSQQDEKYSLEAFFAKVIPRYQQLLYRWLQVLVEQGQLQQEDESFTHLRPLTAADFQALVEETQLKWADEPDWFKRVQRCGNHLAAVLTGESPALSLFSQDTDETEIPENRVVQESPLMQYYTRIMRTTVQQVVKLLPPSATLKILEMGGGSGYGTSAVLPVLPALRTSYTFTDISRLLLELAKQKFSEYPFVQYRLLDLEQSPSEQGYEPHSFDVLIAVNVLHVTRKIEETLAHVRSLLAPSGLFLIWEVTQPQLDFDITDALLMNRLEDGERNQGNPFLSTEQWHMALLRHGFVEVAAVPETDVLGHHILVVQADSSGARTAPSAFTGLLEQPLILPQISLGKQPEIADWFYIPSWKQSLVSAPHKIGQNSVESSTLVFSQECGLCDGLVQRLERQGDDVIRVTIGEKFAKLSDGLYTLNPQQAEDYEALLKELHTLDKPLKTIVHLWTLTTNEYPESQLEGLEKAQEFGFYSLLFLAQAFGKPNVTDEIQITVVSNHLQPVIGSEKLCPEKATLLGPVRTIPQEYPNITCRSIDVVVPEPGSSLAEKLISQLMAELTAPSSDRIIAYRAHERWVQSFEPFRLEHPLEKIPPRLREGGVYLITGGLGGIGLVLAEYLAKTVRAKLILTTRSYFPRREEWPGWLSTHDAKDSISRKILKIQQIEQLGAEVWIVGVDVTHMQYMQEVIMRAKERFGAIHGVIHAAGVYPEGSIQLKTPEMVEQILAPKVRGTIVLDSVLKDFELDFLVLCSSLSSIFGGIVDHCGANAFLDAFAHYNTFQNERFTVSINWDGWQEVGQAAEAATRQYGMAISQTPQEKEVAHPLFDKCLIEGAQEIYVTHFSVLKHWVVDEHRVMGKPTLPGTAYLEMARAALESHANEEGTIELREVYFLTPLIIEEVGETEVRTILTPQENGFEFVILSQSNAGDGQWLEHANGQISRLEVEPPTQYDLKNLEACCQDQEIILTGAEELNVPERFVKVGPRWNTLKQVKFGNHHGLARLALPEPFAADLKTYKLHPALLDGATGFASGKDEGTYLPFSYKRLKIKGPLPAKFYSYITDEDQNNCSQSDTRKFNITIMDEQGSGLVEIEDYTLRRIEVGKLEKTQKTPLVPESQNFYLEIATPGLLESLTFRPAPRQKPGPGEVEIEIYATGLNFMEILIALGMLPFPINKFGLECTGKIVALGKGVETFQIGDEVMAFVSSGFSAFTTTSASLVALKPEHLSLEEAATIPVAFSTAYYALVTLARLNQGESVLIHAAAGGVGLAAVQVASMLGAEIFATAGNPEKRAFLHSLGIEHVMDSRTLAFAEEVMKLTGGRGVDVVLNSLGGEFIPKSLSVLAPFGRFLELGKKDIYQNSQLGLRVFEKGLSFSVVSPAPTQLPNFNSGLSESLLSVLMQHFKDGKLRPLPHQVFPITEVASAFDYMAQAKHIGKIVVSLQNKEAVLKQISKRPMVHSRRHEKTKQSTTSQPAGSVLAQGPVVTNIFQKDINEYLLPTEGVEVFSRILGSQRPQVLVSTIDLPSRLEKSLSTLLSELKESEPQRLSKPAHPRPQLGHAYVAPRNERERQIASIWQDFLGIEQVGIYDDFFELGGDSLLAVQLIAKLRETLQTDLSPHSLLNSPNIAALTESVEQTTTESLQPQVTRPEMLPSLLVEIQSGNRQKPPLFLLHPIGGHVYFYRELAIHLGAEQPVYGIQAQGLDGETEPLTRIEEMATLYIEVLRVRQPEGPYFLGGSSLGGMLAFEMAQQLDALGQQVALLFMVDTPGPGQMPVTLETDVEILAYLLNVGANVAVSLDELGKLEPDEQLRYVLEEQRKIDNQMPLDWDITQLRHSLNIFKVNGQAMWDYQPRGVYQGQILFFRAMEKDAYNAKTPEQAWIELASDGVEVIDVPGNHITMNSKPHIQLLAERLKAYLS
ncbi:MAG: hypothetical protein DRR19_18500 [Candidatus Parabeggiatoa sp. nov. 1]|nr:MAG: hypothetical protein DRR19_18500 [Gammaproteobacteria bacterium]